MLHHRVIPVVLLSGNGLVKTMRFRNPKYIGDPVNVIRIFNEKEVDELMVLDIGATRENHEPNYDLIRQFAGECFMPLAYGGGVKNVDQAQRLFSCGVEKICLQTAALEDHSVVSSLASLFGSQSIVVSVDIKRGFLGKPELYASSRRRTLKINWLRKVKMLIDAGAGEVLLNAVDKDGMLLGPDLELIQQVSAISNVPLISIGGIASLDDIKAAVNAGANAVAASSFFIYHGPHRAVLIDYPRYCELESLFL